MRSAIYWLAIGIAASVLPEVAFSRPVEAKWMSRSVCGGLHGAGIYLKRIAPPDYMRTHFSSLTAPNSESPRFTALCCEAVRDWNGGIGTAGSYVQCTSEAQKGKIGLFLKGWNAHDLSITLTGTPWSHKSGTPGKTTSMNEQELAGFQALQRQFVKNYSQLACQEPERSAKLEQTLLTVWNSQDYPERNIEKFNKPVRERCGLNWGGRVLQYVPPKDPILQDVITFTLDPSKAEYNGPN